MAFLSSLHVKFLSLLSVCWTLSPSAFYVGHRSLLRPITCFVLDKLNACDLSLKIFLLLILLSYHDLHVFPS